MRSNETGSDEPWDFPSSSLNQSQHFPFGFLREKPIPLMLSNLARAPVALNVPLFPPFPVAAWAADEEGPNLQRGSMQPLACCREKFYPETLKRPWGTWLHLNRCRGYTGLGGFSTANFHNKLKFNWWSIGCPCSVCSWDPTEFLYFPKQDHNFLWNILLWKNPDFQNVWMN